jgi:hypothetical protein
LIAAETSTDNATTFAVEYDGEAVLEGRMDVRDLAPALLSLGKLCEETNAVLNGDRAKVRVDVHANFKKGSFGVDLNVVQNVLDAGTTFFKQPAVHSAEELLGHLGIFGGAIATIGTTGYVAVKGVIQLARAIKGGKITAVKEESAGVTSVSVDNSINIHVDSRVYQIYARPAVQEDLKRVVQPLDNEGVEVVRFKRGDETTEQIDRDERQSFEVVRIEPEQIAEIVSERIWRIRSVSFDPSLVWRFYEGKDATFAALITDEAFWREIDSGRRSFKADQILKVRVRATTKRIPGQAKTSDEYEVIEVIDDNVGDEPDDLGLFGGGGIY